MRLKCRLIGTGLVAILIILSACDQFSKNNQEEYDKTSDTSESKLNSLYHYGIDTNQLIPQGLVEGDQAPLFNSVTSEGDSVKLKKILERKPVVVMFYRGQWCPICNKYLQQLEDSVSLIRESGARILAITPETRANAEKMRKQTHSSVSIIPDQGGKIMEAYRVNFKVTDAYAKKIEQGFDVGISDNNGEEKARLPIPATYVIKQDGEIAWRFFNPDYKKRASVKSILKALNKL